MDACKETTAIGFLAQVIDAADPDLGRRAQLRRLAMLWAVVTGATVTADAEGQPHFKGIAKDVFDRFRLPWLGEGIESARPFGSALPGDASTSWVRPPWWSPAPGAPRTSARGRAAADGRETAPAHAVSPTKLRTPVDQAQAWRDGKSTVDPTAWELLLHELMGEVRSTARSVPEAMGETLYEGSGEARRIREEQMRRRHPRELGDPQNRGISQSSFARPAPANRAGRAKRLSI